MTATANLALPLILASQAQKHITHNEALRILDSVTQLAVRRADLTAPPANAADGERYLVAAGAVGGFAGHDGEIALFEGGVFSFIAAKPGWLCWNEAERQLLVFDGAVWATAGASLDGLALLGVNATADAVNRFALASEASLFNHDGAGHRMKINKSASADAASILFQTGFSGRAEIGIVGEDDFVFKVSADGAAFRDAIRLDGETGAAAFPQTLDLGVNHLINGDFAVNQRGFAGGPLGAGAYGYDRWKAGAGGASVALSGNSVTLSSGTLVQIVEAPGLAGRPVTLSVEDLAGGDLAVGIEGQAGVIPVGAGRAGATLTVPATSTGNVVVTLSPVGPAVSFRRVKLEAGRVASGWTFRPPSIELMLCQRYFECLSGAAGDRYIRRGMASLTGYHTHWIQFFAKKRIRPEVVLLAPIFDHADSANVFNASNYGMELQFNVTAAGGFMFFGYAADAEL